jgi:hypothetical protein
MAHSALTQPVRPGDIKNGQLRVPGPAKRLFPRARARIQVELAGTTKDCRWDPGFGPDQDRSGVIGIGKALSTHLSLGAELEITLIDGVYRIV